MTNKTIFRQLLNKAVSMALWTKATLCVKSSLLEQSLPGTPSRPKQNQRKSAQSASKFSPCLCVFCAFLWLKNQCNLLLINDLRSTKDYVRKNKLFMQNKAKFRKVKLNVTKVLIRDYDQMDTWSIRKNEPKTNPNEPKTNPNKPKTNPIQTQSQEQKNAAAFDNSIL
ncbi:MAG: hypothetical protein OEW48_02100 [Phycisphaerae bacterium]|nr:hypothetical protein [Phycisphaerae bacterium]